MAGISIKVAGDLPPPLRALTAVCMACKQAQVFGFCLTALSSAKVAYLHHR